jgi:formylglycine-generating enzyme required for sulfatase activity
VRIARAFALGVYPVTFAEYDRFAAATGREMAEDSGWGREDRPVINVSWDDARAYCTWLTAQTGRDYRLPTEAEWEYAARAGTESAYWGDEIGRNNANCNGCGSRWDNNQTAPVGSFAPNPFGLHDTAGNVWEWVQDCWHESYEGAPADGLVRKPSDASYCGARVLQGGSWGSVPRSLRSANRGGSAAGGRDGDAGFRLARSI